MPQLNFMETIEQEFSPEVVNIIKKSDAYKLLTKDSSKVEQEKTEDCPQQ